MTVYIVSSNWQGDGEIIEGVFESREKANAYIASLEDRVWRFITEYEVQ